MEVKGDQIKNHSKCGKAKNGIKRWHFKKIGQKGGKSEKIFGKFTTQNKKFYT